MTSAYKGANAKTEFVTGFQIDEERVRRILSIINESCEKETVDATRIRVGRTDGLSYETSDVDELAKEENFTSERIDRIAIEAKTNELEFNLEFYDGETKLRVEGQNRNVVQILNSRLHTFLRDDVCTKSMLPRKPQRIIVLLCMFLVMPLTMIPTVMKQPSIEAIEKARGSSDISEKLNFLISRSNETRSGSTGMILLLVLMSILTASLFGGERFYEYFFPPSVFLFGKERERYQKLVSLRAQLGWVIGVGFVVSFLASLALWLMTT